MAASAVLAIDQGTTNSKAVLFGPEGSVVARGVAPLPIYYPLPGWVEPEAVEDDGHYVPPPPPPVPRLAPRKLAAAAVLLAGLLLMFVPGLLLQSRTAGTGVLGVLLTVGGAAALVWLMRDSPPGGSGPDDGAVV